MYLNTFIIYSHTCSAKWLIFKSAIFKKYWYDYSKRNVVMHFCALMRLWNASFVQMVFVQLCLLKLYDA